MSEKVLPSKMSSESIARNPGGGSRDDHERFDVQGQGPLHLAVQGLAGELVAGQPGQGHPGEFQGRFHDSINHGPGVMQVRLDVLRAIG